MTFSPDLQKYLASVQQSEAEKRKGMPGRVIKRLYPINKNRISSQMLKMLRALRGVGRPSKDEGRS